TTDWTRVLSVFRGEIEQIPPMYSAKKQAGKKLYELARQGKEVERKPVKVTIRENEVIKDHANRISPSAGRLRVVCFACTYIRILAEHIGRRLGIGAHLTELRRTRAGKFGLDQSMKLHDLDVSSTRLLPIEYAVSHLPKFRLEDDRI